MNWTIKSLLRCSVFLFALTLSTQAQLAGNTGEVAGTFGYAHVYGVTSDNQLTFGGSGSYNFTPNVSVGFDYRYTPLGSETIGGITSSGHLQTYGAVARFSPSRPSRAVPYVLAGVGHVGETAGVALGQIKQSAGQGGFYIALGGGASLYVAPNWGIRPEFRYERQQFGSTPVFTSFGQNDWMATASIFYQFGGK